MHGLDALGDGVSAWARPLTGGCVAAALLNGGAVAADAEFRLEWLAGSGWGNATRVRVRDMWAHADAPDAVGVVRVPGLRTHATAALRLCTSDASGGVGEVGGRAAA